MRKSVFLMHAMIGFGEVEIDINNVFLFKTNNKYKNKNKKFFIDSSII